MDNQHRADFHRFQSLRGEWLECLAGQDRNSIAQQISAMLWNAAAYRVVNEARRLAPPARDGGVKLSGLMHRLLDECFFTAQVTAIRRLLDQGSIRGKRAVYSLSGLLTDLRKNVDLLTRKHIFAAEALPLDVEPIKAAARKFAAQQRRERRKAYGIPPELRWRIAQARHEQIDRLAAVSADRRPSDTIAADVFDGLQRRLDDVAREVVGHVNKFVAHAATPQDRMTINADEIRLTLAHLWNAHRGIFQVANCVSVFILGGPNLGGLPVPQHDVLEFIERPLVKKGDVPRLREIWRQYETETRQWGRWGIEELSTGSRENNSSKRTDQ